METLLILSIIIAVIAVILAFLSFIIIISRLNNCCYRRNDNDDIRLSRINADINGVIQLANNTSEPLNIVNSNGEIVARINNGNVSCTSNNNNSCCCRR